MVRGSNLGAGRDFSHIQIGSEAHPASYAIGTGSFLEVKWPGRGVEDPPNLSAEVIE
jgi:hypothetical protein